MRLLFAIKSLNVVGGGAERVLVDVANGMAARGHDVRVLTFDSPGESFYALDPKVQRIDTGVGQPGQSTPKTGFLRAIPKIRKAVVNSKPDLTIAFMHSTYVPLTIALMGSDIPMVASEHIDAAHYKSRPIQRALVWIADRLALAKTVPSAPIREQHDPSFRPRVHVMPNAVDLANFERSASLMPTQPPVILSVGRFMEQKNHLELIRAFACLAERFPTWTLKIVGEGDLRSELEAEIEQLGLTSRVRLPGVTRDIASEYAAASIVALPSLYESFGLVAAETLASGRPLLAFNNCLGIAELVKSETNGLLVPSEGDRVANLVAGLERLMKDGFLRQRLSSAGPASVKRYDLKQVVNKWEQLLESLH